MVERRVDLVAEDAPVEDVGFLFRGAEILRETRHQKVELHRERPSPLVVESPQEIVLIPELLRHHLQPQTFRQEIDDRGFPARGHPLDYDSNPSHEPSPSHVRPRRRIFARTLLCHTPRIIEHRDVWSRHEAARTWSPPDENASPSAPAARSARSEAPSPAQCSATPSEAVRRISPENL